MISFKLHTHSCLPTALVNIKTMGYNKRNLLLKIIEVQTIYVEHSKRGATGKWIFNELIYPKFRISRATFYNYLATNAKRELKELDASSQENSSLVPADHT